jgi:hypothetical protein
MFFKTHFYLKKIVFLIAFTAIIHIKVHCVNILQETENIFLCDTARLVIYDNKFSDTIKGGISFSTDLVLSEQNELEATNLKFHFLTLKNKNKLFLEFRNSYTRLNKREKQLYDYYEGKITNMIKERGFCYSDEIKNRKNSLYFTFPFYVYPLKK